MRCRKWCRAAIGAAVFASLALSDPSVSVLDRRWEPLSALPPAAGVGAHPGFVDEAIAMCEQRHHGSRPEDAEVRECFRASVTFCRTHRRVDSYCLLAFHHHYQAALVALSFDYKISVDTQAPPVRLISPQDGDELLDAEGVRFSARTVSRPHAHEGGAPLDCYVTIGQGRLPLKPKRVSGVVQHVPLPPPRLSEFVISISLQGDGPWRVGAMCVNGTTGETAFQAPAATLSRLHPNSCTPRPEWEQIRVYDVFLFNGEADLLEIRLHELHDVVHSFVIIEFDTTFRGRRKEYCLERLLNDPEQRERFEPFLGQIVYLKYSLAEEVGGPWGGQQLPSDKFDPWSLEYLQRDSFTKALAVAGARLSDVVLLLDADELVRREAVMAIKKCHAVHMPADLHLDYYMYYNFHWRKRGLSFHAIACYASLLGMVSSSAIRQLVEGEVNYKRRAKDELMMEPFYPVHDAGWHLSYFMSPEKVCAKLGQFAHSEYDLPPFNTPHDIARRMQQGVDLFDRPEPHDFLGPDQVLPLLPRHVHHNMHRFAHLLPHMPQLQPLQEGGRGNSTSGGTRAGAGDSAARAGGAAAPPAASDDKAMTPLLQHETGEEDWQPSGLSTSDFFRGRWVKIRPDGSYEILPPDYKGEEEEVEEEAPTDTEGVKPLRPSLLASSSSSHAGAL